MAAKWEQANELWSTRKDAFHQTLDKTAYSAVIVPEIEFFSYSKEIGMLGFLFLLGGILLIGALVGMWDGRLLHIGKSHRTVAEGDGFLKTV